MNMALEGESQVTVTEPPGGGAQIVSSWAGKQGPATETGERPISAFGRHYQPHMGGPVGGRGVGWLKLAEEIAEVLHGMRARRDR
jgi:hypothetical protein